jgi:hypothetical protein
MDAIRFRMTTDWSVGIRDRNDIGSFRSIPSSPVKLVMADVVVQGDDNERQRVGEEWLSVVLIEGTCCRCARAGWADREVGDGRAICANGKRLSGQCVCEPDDSR